MGKFLNSLSLLAIACLVSLCPSLLAEESDHLIKKMIPFPKHSLEKTLSLHFEQPSGLEDKILQTQPTFLAEQMPIREKSFSPIFQDDDLLFPLKSLIPPSSCPDFNCSHTLKKNLNPIKLPSKKVKTDLFPAFAQKYFSSQPKLPLSFLVKEETYPSFSPVIENSTVFTPIPYILFPFDLPSSSLSLNTSSCSPSLERKPYALDTCPKYSFPFSKTPFSIDQNLSYKQVAKNPKEPIASSPQQEPHSPLSPQNTFSLNLPKTIPPYEPFSFPFTLSSPSFALGPSLYEKSGFTNLPLYLTLPSYKIKTPYTSFSKAEFLYNPSYEKSSLLILPHTPLNLSFSLPSLSHTALLSLTHAPFNFSFDAKFCSKKEPLPSHLLAFTLHSFYVNKNTYRKSFYPTDSETPSLESIALTFKKENFDLSITPIQSKTPALSFCIKENKPLTSTAYSFPAKQPIKSFSSDFVILNPSYTPPSFNETKALHPLCLPSHEKLTISFNTKEISLNLEPLPFIDCPLVFKGYPNFSLGLIEKPAPSPIHLTKEAVQAKKTPYNFLSQTHLTSFHSPYLFSRDLPASTSPEFEMHEVKQLDIPLTSSLSEIGYASGEKEGFAFEKNHNLYQFTTFTFRSTTPPSFEYSYLCPPEKLCFLDNSHTQIDVPLLHLRTPMNETTSFKPSLSLKNYKNLNTDEAESSAPFLIDSYQKETIAPHPSLALAHPNLVKELNVHDVQVLNENQWAPQAFPSLNDLETLSLDNTFDLEVSYSPKKDGSGYFFALKMSPNKEIMPSNLEQNFIFVIDRSHSIKQHRYQTFKTGIQSALSQLRKGDSFNILTVDAQIEAMHTSSIPYSKKALFEAKTYLNHLQFQGHFAKHSPFFLLSKAQTYFREDKSNVIIFITDGNAFDDLIEHKEELLTFSKQNKGTFSLFTAASSQHNNLAMLDLISTFNNGEMMYSQTNAAFPRKLSKLVKHIKHLVASNMRLHSTSKSTSNIAFYPNGGSLPALYEDRPYLMYGTVKTLEDFDLILQGKTGNQWLNIKQHISFEKAIKSTSKLKRDFALQQAYVCYDNYLEKEDPYFLEEAKNLLAPLMISCATR